MTDYFSRCHDYDPAEMNTLADLVAAGIEDDNGRFCTLTERYGTAVAIIESDWLRQKLFKAWENGKDSATQYCEQPSVVDDELRELNPFRSADLH